MKKTKIYIGIGSIVLLAVGFFAGMEYKSYQVRSAFQSAFNVDKPSTTEGKTFTEQAKEENMVVHTLKTGDEITLSALTLKVNKVDETQTISSNYSTPKTAKEGTKFVVVELTVKNITNSEFMFFPDDGLSINDAQGREFKSYSDAIGNVNNYLNSRELSPSVPETGVIVFELPIDATSYSLYTSKAGSKDAYKVILK